MTISIRKTYGNTYVSRATNDIMLCKKKIGNQIENYEIIKDFKNKKFFFFFFFFIMNFIVLHKWSMFKYQKKEKRIKLQKKTHGKEILMGVHKYLQVLHFTFKTNSHFQMHQRLKNSQDWTSQKEKKGLSLTKDLWSPIFS